MVYAYCMKEISFPRNNSFQYLKTKEILEGRCFYKIIDIKIYMKIIQNCFQNYFKVYIISKGNIFWKWSYDFLD